MNLVTRKYNRLKCEIQVKQTHNFLLKFLVDVYVELKEKALSDGHLEVPLLCTGY